MYLSSTMKEKDTHHDLNGLEESAGSLQATPFTVPDHYFEESNRRILQRCQHIVASEAAFTPPADYFDQLQDRILIKVAEEKLREKAGASGFTVPAGYFEVSQAALLNRISQDERALAIPPVRRIIPRTWLRYAAAACVAGVLGIMGYLGLVNREESRLATVSDQEILSYLEFYGEPADITYIAEYLDRDDDIAVELNELSEEDIEAYLNNTL